MRWCYVYFYVLRGNSLPSFPLSIELLIFLKPKSPNSQVPSFFVKVSSHWRQNVFCCS